MGNHKQKKYNFFTFLLTAALLLNGCVPSPSQPADPEHTDMVLHFIDVGQGDSILAESNGHYMLIDAGNNDKADYVVNYLKSQDVDTLDYLIGTHPDADHIGGLDAVIHNFDIGKIIMPPVEHTTQTFEDVLDAISSKGMKITKPVTGTEYQLGDGFFTILAPNASYGDDLNDWSVGIKLSNGSNHFLLCGDAEAAAEHDIGESGMDIKADVLKLSHHGSSTSSSEEFLDKVDPSFAIISCGKDNSYGHPHKETLSKLSDRGIKTYRTDELGTIIAVSNGSEIFWPASDTNISAEFMINTGTKKFHYINCSSVKQISDKNKKPYEGSRNLLISEGYRACKKCNP